MLQTQKNLSDAALGMSLKSSVSSILQSSCGEVLTDEAVSLMNFQVSSVFVDVGRLSLGRMWPLGAGSCQSLQ